MHFTSMGSFLIGSGLMRTNHFILSMKALSVLALMLFAAPANAGILDDISEDVRRERESDSNYERPKPREHDDDFCDDGCDDDDSFKEALGTAILIGITAPFWGPPLMMQDDYSDIGGFPEYPYKHGQPGLMQIEPSYGTPRGKWLMLRTRGEYANTFDGVQRVGGQFLFDTTSRFGVDTEFNLWTEDQASGLPDELWTGDVNLVFRFAQSPRMQMRTGVGINWFSDDQGMETGFNFTYSADFFPVDPVVMTAELDLGAVGEVNVVHFRSTIGLHFHRVEIYTGYDHFSIGETELDSLIAGIRLWL